MVYKGSTLIVPIWTNWIAVDADGSIGVCENKPVNGEDFWDSILYVGKVEFEANEDWKQSLEYVGG